MIRVTEYWPTFVDKTEPRRVSYAMDEKDVMQVPWLAAKQPSHIEWDVMPFPNEVEPRGYVMKDYGKQGKFVIAQLKHVPSYEAAR